MTNSKLFKFQAVLNDSQQAFFKRHLFFFSRNEIGHSKIVKGKKLLLLKKSERLQSSPKGLQITSLAIGGSSNDRVTLISPGEPTSN